MHAINNRVSTIEGGKLDELNIHPVNSSISMTLNQDQLMTTTRLVTGPDLTNSSFSLNGRMYEDVPGRIKDVIIIGVDVFPLHSRVSIWIAFGLTKLYRLDEDPPSLARRGSGSACRSLYGGFVHWIRSNDTLCSTGGSQTHCSTVHELYPASYWPELKVLICVASSHKKSIGSTTGMQRTVNTSQLFQRARCESVKQHELLLLSALRDRDFENFARIAMQESNQLHAVCLDTWPPCIFLTDVSLKLMNWVHLLNRFCGKTVASTGGICLYPYTCETISNNNTRTAGDCLIHSDCALTYRNVTRSLQRTRVQHISVMVYTFHSYARFVISGLSANLFLLSVYSNKVAYTFDAGPNAFLFAEESNVSFLLHLLALCFGTKSCETTLDVPSSDHVYVTDPVDTMAKSLLFRGIKYPVYSRPIDTKSLENSCRISNRCFVLMFEETTGVELTTKAVESATLAFQCVCNVHGIDGLSLGVLGVGDDVTDNVLKEHLEDTAGLLVDRTSGALHTTSASETADGRLGDLLDVIAENLAMTFSSSFPSPLPSIPRPDMMLQARSQQNRSRDPS
ncbi:hypothetical protein T265_11156 [Opisthorchis viverrini]|uniref:Uncharacterized protein n=1 Tax=Opisthorchis viverrini TaxID=6198 RepID=A0A074ZAK6_OPIVI|nr:hypothetical protein T265_11156 [Opisthorchis viverrini]KER20250.1 hypothetical protein T265_11156 [Opisthorchis viverrini]